MPLLLVGPRELAAARLAREGLLARVRSDVRGEVVRAREGSHADAALEGLLAGVDADVAREFVGAREAAVTAVDGAGVGALVERGLRGAVRVLARLHRQQLQGTALVRLAQDLVALGRIKEKNG